jgi:hypothetical protein
LISLDQAIEAIQAVDGYGRTPCVINNFSVVKPITLSALVARTDTAILEKLASQTNGQSQSVIDEETLSIVLNNSLGRLVGSIGYGMYECVVDLKNDNIVNSIGVEFEIYPNTDGNWSISTSSDGYSYTEYSDQFDYHEIINFADLHTRYIKFKVVLLSGLSASIDDEYALIPTPGVPALTKINIKYSDPQISYIYLNTDVSEYSAQQVAIAISANKPQLSTIEVGAATSEAWNWDEFATGGATSNRAFWQNFYSY